MQRGSLVKSKRKQGPEVWQFRWSEKGPNTKRVYRRRVIGTVEQYPDEAAARRPVEVLLSEINSQQRIARCNPLTTTQLGDHFEQRELGRDHTWRSHATKKTYKGHLKLWTLPYWGRAVFLTLERSKSSPSFGIFRWQEVPALNSEI